MNVPREELSDNLFVPMSGNLFYFDPHPWDDDAPDTFKVLGWEIAEDGEPEFKLVPEYRPF